MCGGSRVTPLVVTTCSYVVLGTVRHLSRSRIIVATPWWRRHQDGNCDATLMYKKVMAVSPRTRQIRRRALVRFPRRRSEKMSGELMSANLYIAKVGQTIYRKKTCKCIESRHHRWQLHTFLVKWSTRLILHRICFHTKYFSLDFFSQFNAVQ